jgi:hypothetical protein
VTVRDEEAGRAAGEPAPFTPAQVEQLARGTLSEDDVASVLDASPTPARKRHRSTKQSPISLSETELRRLTRDGVTPAEVSTRLKAAVSTGTREPERDEAGERPTRQPPSAGRGR